MATRRDHGDPWRSAATDRGRPLAAAPQLGNRPIVDQAVPAEPVLAEQTGVDVAPVGEHHGCSAAPNSPRRHGRAPARGDAMIGPGTRRSEEPMVDQQSFWIGFLTGRRAARRGPDRPFVRKRPKMPSTPWRIAAVPCVVVGMLVAAVVPGGLLVPKLIGGAVVGFVVGMYVVETMWERRRAASGRWNTSGGPIGPRR